MDLSAHVVLPWHSAGRALWDEDEVCSATTFFQNQWLWGVDKYARNTGHQSQPAAVASHNFYHEGARVTVRGGVDVVDRLADALERSRRANRQIRQGHVVVDRAHEAHELKVRMRLKLLLRDQV